MSSFKVCMSDAHTTVVREDRGACMLLPMQLPVYMSILLAECSVA
jgi:hypothetical protein